MASNLFSLEGKVAVVTGASRGFGRAIALGLADAGADIVLAARTESSLNEVAAEIEAKGRRALAVPADMGSKESVSNLATRTIEG